MEGRRFSTVITISTHTHVYSAYRDTASLVTHQENPLQLILDVLHPGKGSHSLDHLDENAANSPLKTEQHVIRPSIQYWFCLFIQLNNCKCVCCKLLHMLICQSTVFA